LEEPTAGEVVFNGNGRGGATRNPDGTHPNDVTKFSDAELKRFRRGAQMIFQDPASSFDPRMTVGSAVAEMLEIHGMSDRHRRRAIVEDLLERVGLSAVDYDRYPHEFSGGQKQRIALARALVLNPDLIIADEPVSALDVSIQAEILSLIDDLQAEFDLSMLFISHDMSVIRRICDRVAVMYLGEIVEVGPTDGSSPTRNTLHRGVAVVDPDAGSAVERRRDRTHRHGTEPDESAERLPVPHAVSPRHPAGGDRHRPVRLARDTELPRSRRRRSGRCREHPGEHRRRGVRRATTM